MANIKKSYNFRDGVQVDNDNFVVTSLGLVGIGVSIPTELLDVDGNIKSSGFVTASQVTTGNLTVTSSGQFNTINVGIVSITPGIVTATSGVVTYYGDGGRLLNLPTSQWLDVDPGIGFTSIYSQGNVGVGTTMPQFSLQIGGNGQTSFPSFTRGIGISSSGDILVSGVLTSINIDVTDLTISGIATGSFSGIGSELTSLNASQLSFGTIPNDRFGSNVQISGILTANTFVGSLTGTATTAVGIVTTSNITINSATAEQFIVNDNIGIGTNTTNSDIHIRRSGQAIHQVTSTSAESIIVIGRDINISQNNSQIRFGNTDGAYTYSNSDSLDILNFDTGSFNYYLNVQGGNANWNWIYGSSNLRMRLTYDGKLGIGVEVPSETFHVVGTSTVTSNAWIGGNLSISQDLIVNDAVSTNSLLSSNFIGISTDSTFESFQINGNPDFSQSGVTISRSGNINSSGVTTSNSLVAQTLTVNGTATATNFSGNGSAITSLNASNISSGTLNNSRLETNLNIAGIVTASSFSGSGSSITSINANNITSGTLNNSRLPENLNITGIGTFTNGVSSGDGVISIEISGSNLIFTNTANGQSVTLTLT